MVIVITQTLSFKCVLQLKFEIANLNTVMVHNWVVGILIFFIKKMHFTHEMISLWCFIAGEWDMTHQERREGHKSEGGAVLSVTPTSCSDTRPWGRAPTSPCCPPPRSKTRARWTCQWRFLLHFKQSFMNKQNLLLLFG